MANQINGHHSTQNSCSTIFVSLFIIADLPSYQFSSNNESFIDLGQFQNKQ